MNPGQRNQFGHFRNTQVINRIYKRINDLGLERYVMELELCGLAIIPPEKVAPPDFIDSIRDTALHIGEERTGDELRLNVTSFNCHRFKNQESYRETVTREIPDRNPLEFTRLVGVGDFNGWQDEAPDYARNIKYADPDKDASLPGPEDA